MIYRIVDRLPTRPNSDQCEECGGQLVEQPQASRLNWLFECDTCDRRVYG